MTTSVTVCICTFRRPAQLDALLAALASQSLADVRLDVQVVDNDPAHSAREVLERWRDRLALGFQHLPEPNIAAARNAAVGAAQGDWLAFIDDDEMPQSDWVAQLLATQRQTQADAVLAPVVPEFAPGVPDWLQQGGYFDRQRQATGSRVPANEARTGNVLLRSAAVRAIPGPFEVAFGRTGGEDTQFFRDLQARQAVLVWCDEAPVSEHVPADRASARWLLQRSFRVGQTWVRSELFRLSPAQRVARGAALGARALVQGLIAFGLAAVLLPVARIRSFRWLRVAVSQAGKLSAFTHFQYNEYGHR